MTGIENLDLCAPFSIDIAHNSTLSYCDAISICEYLENPTGSVTIHSNAEGCNNPPEIANACMVTLPCLPYGNYYFYNQVEVDSFQSNYPECDTLFNTTSIGGDDITNLNGLSNVKAMLNYVLIHDCDSLESLSGLMGLSSVGNLFILDNDLISDLTGLDSLSTIDGLLDVGNNECLRDLHGIHNLDTINGHLGMQGNNLLSLSALKNLVSIERKFFDRKHYTFSKPIRIR